VNGLRLALVLAAIVAGPAHAQSAADDPGNWTMPGRDYASTRFSPLDQLNAGNVGKLALAWTFSTGVLRGHEAAPIVADNTLFIVTPFPNVVMRSTSRNRARRSNGSSPRTRRRHHRAKRAATS
jgi:glucose dehydrogenase